MSTEDIRHVYCDGPKCCQSIDGYNPHAKNIDDNMAKDLLERGWLVIENDDVIEQCYIGLELISEYGETQHFCPTCKAKLTATKVEE